jgi:hypothetical protein
VSTYNSGNIIGRGLYTASNGNLYAVVGYAVYYIDLYWNFNLIGTLPSYFGPVDFSDNGINVVLCDGSLLGWTWDLNTNTFSQIGDPNFIGGRAIDFMDSYLLFTRPGTPIFYCSLSNAVTFDPLYLVGVKACNRQILLCGTYTSEIWYDAGTPDFPFGEMPGMMIQHGSGAPYSMAKQDTSIFFLGQNLQGDRVVMRVSEYVAQRVSNYALEKELQTYAVVSDATGYCYQLGGHVFYVLNFPTADKTWVYDAATGQWHEWLWQDPKTGILHRHRIQMAAFAYGINVGLDWENGALYQISPDVFTDNGIPIRRNRMFPHVTSDGKRLFHRRVIADIECGNDVNPADLPKLELQWSDDRGASWGNSIFSDLGKTGNYIKSCQFQRLGMTWDRVYSLSWSANCKTSLNGFWVEFEKAAV